MILTVLQMHSTPDAADNIETAHALMSRAAKEHRSDWLLLPEHFHWAGGDLEAKRRSAEILREGPAYLMCRDFARTHKVFVHAGSIFERIPGDQRIYNTSVALDRDGNEIACYRKVHMFDITGSDGTEYRESATVKPGEQAVVYDADGLKIGCAICYDLRFPELFQALVKKGAHLIALPAAFTYLTGKDHWETLIRARAIETQTYLAASGSYGTNAHGGVTYRTYGHSMLVDPWGKVVELLPEGDDFVSCRLDRDLLEKVRRDIPLAGHRKQPLYTEWMRHE
jgi:predicted amidohydrolase